MSGIDWYMEHLDVTNSIPDSYLGKQWGVCHMKYPPGMSVCVGSLTVLCVCARVCLKTGSALLLFTECSRLVTGTDTLSCCL